MIILRHHRKKTKQKKTNSSLRRISKIELVKAVQTSKKATLESMEICSLVKLDFGRLLVLPALKRRLDKAFIGSLLVSGPNISICRYPKTPWDSNAHFLN